MNRQTNETQNFMTGYGFGLCSKNKRSDGSMNLSAVFGDYIRETGFKIEWGGDDLDDFEILLCECRGAVERFVNFRLPSKFDAEDVLQEVYLAAHSKFGTLQDRATFKAWLIGIARHKCNDYYPKRAKSMEIPLEEISETALSCGRMGITETSVVHETLGRLAAKDQEMLTLYFFRDLPQSEIAKKLGIPIGTVKSRLHVAKQNFKQSYPYPPKPKGDDPMKKLPEFMPEYQIAKSDKAPFSVVWEELMGWFLVPKLGEKLSFGIYDMPSRKCDHFYDMAVTGKAEVHGSPYLTAAIPHPVLADETAAGFLQTVPLFEGTVTAQLSVKELLILPDVQLYGTIGCVAEPVIHIFIKNRGTHAERNTAVGIRE